MTSTIVSYDLPGEALMQIDQELLDRVKGRESFLHLFRWPISSLSLGCLLKEEGFLLPQQMPTRRVRRPTGGGAMLHGHDFCFSLIVGPDHPLRKLPALALYEGVHQAVRQALEKHDPTLKGRFSLIDSSQERAPSDPKMAGACCMTHPTRYDLALDRKKLIGSAQRRKKGLLHQCSLHVEPPDFTLIKNQFVDSATYATMIRTTSTWLSEHLRIDWPQLEAIIQDALLAYLKKSDNF